MSSHDEFLAMRLAHDKIPGVNDRYINASPVKLRESLLKYFPIRLIRQMQTGESRTSLSTTSSSMIKIPFNRGPPSELISNDPAKLLSELIGRLIAIGDVVRKLNQALDHNGHQPDGIQKLLQEIFSEK